MNIKKRNWAFVLYPESAPADWLERLQATGLPGAISPLHDKTLTPQAFPKNRIIMLYCAMQVQLAIMWLSRLLIVLTSLFRKRWSRSRGIIVI